MSSKDEFIGNLTKAFLKRQRSPYLIKDYFFNKPRWDRLQKKAKYFGVYFWVHLNFGTNKRSILRIGNIADRHKDLFDDSTDEEGENCPINIVSKKEIEIYTFPFKPCEPKIEDSEDDWSQDSSPGSPNDGDIVSVSTASSADSEDSLYQVTSTLLGLVPDFPIDLCDSSDDDSCMDTN